LTLPTNDLFFLDPEKKWWLNHHLCGLLSIFKNEKLYMTERYNEN
jgi:hypothetical protein